MQYDPTNPDYLSELLSAYLDGEVTAEEQALVEQQLAENSEFRQLHDELMALRAGLESLPRYQLKEDLAPVVLRRAEKAMLAAPAVSELGNVPHEDQSVALAEPTPMLGRIARTARAMRWSLVAIAVAVMIMIFNSKKDGDLNNREVAKVDHAAKMDASAEISAAPMGEIANEGDRFAAPERLGRETLDPYMREREEAGEIAPPMTLGAEVPRGGRGVGGGAATVERYAGKSAAPAAITNGRNSQVEGDFLVVRCDISAEAARSNAFEQLLEKQQIAVLSNEQPVWYSGGQRLNEKASSVETLGNLAEDGGGALNRPAKQESASQLSKPAVKLSEKPASKSESSELQSKRNSTSGSVAPAEVSAQQEPQTVEGYLVEASPDQIQATLDSLKTRTDLFATVEEELPTDETQLRFAPAFGAEPKEADVSGKEAAAEGAADSIKSVDEAARKLEEKNRSQESRGRYDSKAPAGKGEGQPGKDYDYAIIQQPEGGRDVGQTQTLNIVGANARRVFVDQQLPQAASNNQAPAAAENGITTFGYRQNGPVSGAEPTKELAKDKELSDRKVITDESSTAAPATSAVPRSTPTDAGKDELFEADKSGEAGQRSASPPMRVLFLLRVVPQQKASQ